uniref:Thymidylate kinase n=2 Tax=Paenibacillus athensensis TaxID=1967502 RepID=A0A4Y8PT21_9BACL
MQANPYPGKLIVLDGIDGSGKSTLLNRISSFLSNLNQPHVVTKTPSEEVREMHLWRAWHDDTLGVDRERIHEYGLTVIALGDRLVHQRSVVEANLQNNVWVLTDRYLISSLAFESGIVHQKIGELLIKPDLSILVDVPPALAMERVRQRTYETEHPDDERVANLTRERLLQLVAVNDYNHIIVNTGVTDPEATFEQVKGHLERLDSR